ADNTDRLAQLISGTGRERADEVAAAAERAWRCFARAWAGDRHRSNMDRRDASEPEFNDPDAMMRGSPFGKAAWAGLRKAVEGYAKSLPPELKAWSRLGELVATV